MEKTSRTFIAIEMNNTFKNHLENIIKNLNNQFPTSVKWVDVNNIHLTLKFLGDFPISQLSTIQNNLFHSFSSLPVFGIKSQNLGVFPNLKNPRVLWLGTTSPIQLKTIYTMIEDYFYLLDYEKETKLFQPHLTIGRVKNYVTDIERRKIGEFFRTNFFQPECSMVIDHISIIKSILTPQGPIYEILFKIPLSGDNGLC